MQAKERHLWTHHGSGVNPTDLTRVFFFCFLYYFLFTFFNTEECSALRTLVALQQPDTFVSSLRASSVRIVMLCFSYMCSKADRYRIISDCYKEQENDSSSLQMVADRHLKRFIFLLFLFFYPIDIISKIIISLQPREENT